MRKTVEDVRNELIDTFGEGAERYGMTRIAGLVKGILLTAREPLSLDDMAEMLEVSKASVSTNVRVLERWKVVRRVFNRGDRKNYYQIRGDLWEIETEIVTTMLKDELEGFADCLDRWKEDLSGAEDRDAEDGAFLQKRLGEFDEYLDAMKHILKIFTREGKVTPAVIKKIEIT